MTWKPPIQGQISRRPATYVRHPRSQPVTKVTPFNYRWVSLAIFGGLVAAIVSTLMECPLC